MRGRNMLLAGGIIAMGASQSLVDFAFRQMTRAKKQSGAHCLAVQSQAGAILPEQLDGLNTRQVSIQSHDGLRLNGWLLPGVEPVQQVIILVHGYTATSSWMLHLALPFMRRGWTALLIDQRAHGESEGHYATYGYLEKHDLQLWVDLMLRVYGGHVKIGLLGQSMGGGTVLEYAALNEHARFIIADCAYSDMRHLIQHQMVNRHHLPPLQPLLQLLDRKLQRRAGFRMADVSPIRVISQTELPIMFIHGEADDFVPTCMSQEMYDQKPGQKKLLLIPQAGHVRAYLTDKQRYEQEVFSFIAEAIRRPT